MLICQQPECAAETLTLLWAVTMLALYVCCMLQGIDETCIHP